MNPILRFGRQWRLPAFLLLLLLEGTASGAKVYVLRGGDSASDNQAIRALTERGHSATAGAFTYEFNGSQASLSEFDAVVVLHYYYLVFGIRQPMPDRGLAALRDYILNGGHVVTGEFFHLAYAYIALRPELAGLLPAKVYSYSDSSQPETYTSNEPDPILNNGLPASFQFGLRPQDRSTANMTALAANPGARLFYQASLAGGQADRNAGVVGIEHAGGGRVISFNTLISAIELQNPNYRRLFVNAVEWAANLPPPPPCTFSISPANTVLPATGGTGSVSIAASASTCAWTAASNVPWLMVTSGAAGTGSGVVQYAVQASTAASPRTGTITIAGQTFTVNQAGTALTFLIGPSPLVFSFREGESQPQDSLLYVFSSAPGLQFTMAVSGGNWLTAVAGTVSISVSVNPAGLAPGNYRGTVTVNAPGAEPPSRTAEVRVTVEAGGQPKLSVEPRSGLTFSLSQGAAASAQRLSVVNLGAGTLAFQAAVVLDGKSSWLSVRPQTGTAVPAAPASLEVVADPRGLSPGTYTGRITVGSAGGAVEIPVTLSVSAVQERILLSQAGLSFTAVAQGGADPPQSFGILNIGLGVLNWTASASVTSGRSGWLSVSPASGSTDASSLTVPLVDVAVNSVGLEPGEYYGQIRVTAFAADNSPQFVSVVLRVLPVGSDPGPVVRPSGMIFTGVAGAPTPSSQIAAVSNITAGTKSFSSGRLASEGRGWFTHLPEQGAVSARDALRVIVQPETAGLSAGVRRGALTFLFADGAVRNLNLLLLLVPGGGRASARAADGCVPTKLYPLFTALGDQFSVAAAWPTFIEVRVVDDCGQPLRSGSVVVTFSNGDPPLALVSLKDGRWTGTWQGRTISTDRVTLTASAEVPGTEIRGTARLDGSLRESADRPLLARGGLPPLLSPGGVVTIYGSRLADAEVIAKPLPLPTDLGGTRVLVAGRALPLYYASDAQINAQVPYDVPVNTRHQLIVSRGGSSTLPEAVTVAPAQPSVFTTGAKDGQGLIFSSSGVLVGPEAPVATGDVIVIYCTGLGAVDPAVPAGSPARAEPLARVAARVTVTIGGKLAEVHFAGLAPGFVGLYQVNAVVPAEAAPGDGVPLVVTVEGQSSPPVMMSVR